MSRINLVIMGTPRSGTTYMTHVLNACGLRTFHQVYFTPGSPPAAWRYDGRFAEVSPAAFALRREIPKSALVLHQVRNPIDCINSLIHSNHCHWDRDSPGRNAWDRMQYRAIQGVCIDWHHDQHIKCAQFWEILNKRMHKFAEERNGWTYRIESIDVDLIERIFAKIKVPIDRSRIRKVLDSTSKTINRLHNQPKERITWDRLSRRQIQQAAMYGYTPGAV